MYRYGTWPPVACGLISGMVWLVSWRIQQWRPHRSLAGYLALALALGPGLLTNVILKNLAHRPRPREVLTQDGGQAFVPLHRIGPTHTGHSFPSGHAAAGFYWLALAVFYWRRRRGLAQVWFALALIYGSLMAFARVAQGSHWLSDVVWAAGLMYFSAWTLRQSMEHRLDLRDPSPAYAES